MIKLITIIQLCTKILLIAKKLVKEHFFINYNE